MIVLGLDTATQASAVALRLADGSIAQARDDPPPGEHPGHATRLLAMTRELLDAADVRWAALERIAVGVGPGTFTGLRVGIATARGLAQSLSAELVGVSSLQALAWSALDAARAQQADGPLLADGSLPDAILAVIDARRGEVFAAAYERGEGESPRELSAPRALAPEALGSVVAQAEEAGGGGPRRWLALGDGALRFGAQLDIAGVPAATGSSPLHRVSAAAICELGARMPAAAGCEQILPDYRRRPDAEIALEGAGAARGAAR